MWKPSSVLAYRVSGAFICADPAPSSGGWQHSGAGQEQIPDAGDALERPRAPLLEHETRSGHQVPHGLRYEHLAGTSFAHDACADVHRDTAGLLAHLHLAGVESRADLDVALARRVADGQRAPDRAR